jgi:hypothetical protein
MPIVQSRNQRDAAARRGSAGRIVDARRRILAVTVGARAPETVRTKDGESFIRIAYDCLWGLPLGLLRIVCGNCH